MNKKAILIIILMLISINIAIAVKPTPQTNPITTTSLTIAYPKAQAFRYGDEFDLYFHVFNASNNIPLTNTSVNCTIHIYNDTNNEHIVTSRLEYIGNYDWEFEGNSSYFYKTGFFPYITYCWSGEWGGAFVSDEILISVDGEGELSSNSTLFLGFIIIIPLILAYLLLKFSSTLGEEHNLFKLLTSLLSIGLVLASLWLSTTSIIKFYLWNEMTENLATLTNIIGWIYFIILGYFIVYLLIKAITSIENKEQEKINI